MAWRTDNRWKQKKKKNEQMLMSTLTSSAGHTSRRWFTQFSQRWLSTLNGSNSQLTCFIISFQNKQNKYCGYLETKPERYARVGRWHNQQHNKNTRKNKNKNSKQIQKTKSILNQVWIDKEPNEYTNSSTSINQERYQSQCAISKKTKYKEIKKAT